MADRGMTRRGPGPSPVTLRVNGRDREAWIEPRQTLLETLRDELGLTGTKEVCDLGQCGACSLLVDGRLVYSCITLAVECAGRDVTTIEGLATGQDLHPVQRAFIETDAYQCGYCTPGQVMATVALLAENAAPSEDDARRALAGNLCRCGAYQNLVRAALRAAAIASAGER